MGKETRLNHARVLISQGVKEHPYIEEFKDVLFPSGKTVHSGTFKKGHKRNSHEIKECA